MTLTVKGLMMMIDHARTAHDGLTGKTGRGSLQMVPHPPDYPIGQGTGLNWTDFEHALTHLMEAALFRHWTGLGSSDFGFEFLFSDKTFLFLCWRRVVCSVSSPSCETKRAFPCATGLCILKIPWQQVNIVLGKYCENPVFSYLQRCTPPTISTQSGDVLLMF